MRFLRHPSLIGLGLVASVAVGLASCSGKKDTAPKPPSSIPISVVPAQTMTLAHTLEASGSIAAWQESPVGSEIGGLTALAVTVDEGSYVREGQVLVRLENAVLNAQLEQAQANIASARASLAQASADLSRAKELRSQGFLAQSALDAKLAAQQTASAKVAAALASETEVRARLAQTVIRAPVSGLISERMVVKGQIVAAGSQLFTIVRDGRLELNAQVPEAELYQVHPGMTATISSDQIGGTSGRVRLITPQVDEKARVGLVRIALSSNASFRPGMFARSSIQLPAQPTLTVPQTAVLFRNEKAGVFIVDQASHARFRPVTTGSRTSDMVAVLSGLTSGERVVIQGAGFLTDGDLVKIIPATAGKS
jgi:RND family efflux transporter MFP subunit